MKTQQFKMGSLFDGSGGFPLASALCDIEPVWASEVEPFPIKVTRARFPKMKHYGDISNIDGAELEPVDLITGGSPCQDMSVAGKRQGMSKKCPKCSYSVVGNKDIKDCPECGTELEYTRSGLFMEQIRIIKEMRKKDELGKLRSGRTDEHIRPRFMLWENVTGAFSSNKGEDFRAVLEETAKVVDRSAVIPRPPKGKWKNAGLIVGDGYSIAWRVFDAQYWGVPQRRRRIALVADFGGQCAGEILFKREGLSRNFTESRQSWQGASRNPQTSTGETIELHTIPLNKYYSKYLFENHSQDTRYKGPLEIAPTVSSTYGMGGNNQPFIVHKKNTTETIRCYDIGDRRSVANESIDISPTITARMGTGGNNVPVILPKKCYATKTYDSKESDISKKQASISRTLDTNGGSPGCNQGGLIICRPEVCCLDEEKKELCHEAKKLIDEIKKTPISTESAKMNENNQTIVFSQNQRNEIRELGNKAGSIMANPGMKQQTYIAQKTIPIQEQEIIARENEYIVRKLTPLECSRLQGFPDWWCDNLKIENPNGHDISFWRGVFETHRKIVTGASKPKTDKQIIKWLKEEPTDGAIYKMWGNGIALPCFLYVIEGIKEILERTSKEPQK